MVYISGHQCRLVSDAHVPAPVYPYQPPSSVLEYVVLVDREQVDVVLVLDRLGVGVQGRVEELLHFLLASASFN